jgi:hypothetical protein
MHLHMFFVRHGKRLRLWTVGNMRFQMVFILVAPAPLAAPHNPVPAGLNASASQTNFQTL